MDATLKNMLESGKTLLTDTKLRKPKVEQMKPPKKGFETEAAIKGGQIDPHRSFVKRTIENKPKKSDLIEDIKVFIEKAEAEI